MMSDVPHSTRVDRSFSLSTLFLLTTACASVLVLITPLVRSNVGEEIGLGEFVAVVIGCGMWLGMTGIVVGLFHYRRLVGAMTGLMLGILLGVVAGPLAFVPPEDFSHVLMAAAGGAVTLLGVAAKIRLAGDGWSKGDPRGSAMPTREPKRHPLDPDPEDDS
jgi:hypothetical protein